MRRAWHASKLFLLPTAAVAVALVLAPDRAELAIHVWLLVLLGLACVVLRQGRSPGVSDRELTVSRQPANNNAPG